MGRPSKYTPELVKSICDQLAQGIPLTVICRGDGMPDPSTVRDWQTANEDVLRDIARARELGFDAIAEQALVIADTPLEGVTEKYEPVTIPNPDDPDLPPVEEFRITERKVEDMIGHRKLQIETRLKLLAKWDPRRYGDKVQVDNKHSGSVGMTILTAVPGAEPDGAAE